MKKLALLVTMAALAMFMVAPMASAHGHHWGGIHGTYAMTGTGNCLWTPSLYNGLPNDFVAIPPPSEHPEYMTDLMTGYRADPTYSSHVSVQGLWEFRFDGTGTAQFTHFGVSAPPIVNVPSTTFGVSGSMKYHFDFRYYFDDDGLITIEMVPDPNIFQGYMTSGPKAGLQFTVDTFTFSGIISADHKTLTLTTKNEKQTYVNYPKTAIAPFPGQELEKCSSVCNSGRILIRVSR